MVRPLIIGLSVLTAIGLLPIAGFYLVFGSLGPHECEPRQVFAEAVSPDGSWTARFSRNVWCGGLVTAVDDTVEIVRPNEMSQSLPTVGVVFGMDDPTYGRPRPMALKWLSTKELEITIPNDAWVARQQSTLADIAISYKYTPDDPTERACLKRWRALPTDEMVRRMQSRTDDARAFLAKCEADLRPR